MLTDTLPLSRADPASPLLWLHERSRAQPLTLGRFLAQAESLATRLPPNAHVINLCGKPELFLLAFVAALLRANTNLLPPNRLAQTLGELAARHTACMAIADDSEEMHTAQRAGLPCLLLSDDDLRTSSRDATQIPHVPSSHLAAVLFTSGSTGASQIIPKPWHTLVRGAAANARASLAGTAATVAMVGTVPCQHSYGLETMIMLPLQGYATLVGERPFYPSDIAAALESVAAPRILVTTPVHLRALTDSGLPLPPLQAIWSATAPLSAELATRVEQQYRTPMHEIFGCSEVGTCATRRTTQTDVWTLLPEFSLRSVPDNELLQLHAEHVEQPYALQDHVELLDNDRRFRLLGRGADMLNIAGKRASLADLNKKLLGIRGVVDGVIFLPDHHGNNDANLQRTAALVVAPTLSHDALLAALRELIEPAFMPRPLYLVDKLPRNEVAKLPRQALLTMLAELERAHG